MKLVFATRNSGKVTELRQLVADIPGLEVISALDLDLPDVIEDGDTFAANATKKAVEVSRATGLPALADDSGLMVEALGGAPGVISARYAGADSDDAKNNQKLLTELEGVGDRRARFHSTLAFAHVAGALGERVITSDGRCEGQILAEARGDGGFGYDPLFFCPELGMTFAEAGTGTKSNVSHRARAMEAMKPHLLDYFAKANR